MLPGDTLYAALFGRLQAKVTLCKTFSRKWIPAQKVGPDQQPALLCLEGDELPQEDPSEPSIWTLEAVVVAYARTNDSATPGTVLSSILDQIKGALDPQPEEGCIGIRAHTNLGLPRGVERVFISGRVEKEDGALTDGQGWLSLSIHIVAIP